MSWGWQGSLSPTLELPVQSDPVFLWGLYPLSIPFSIQTGAVYMKSSFKTVQRHLLT